MSCIIQKQIKVSEEFIAKAIKEYEKTPKHFEIGFGDFMGNKDDIIREIKKRSDVGKELLLMKYKFMVAYPDLVKRMKKKNGRNKITKC